MSKERKHPTKKVSPAHEPVSEESVVTESEGMPEVKEEVTAQEMGKWMTEEEYNQLQQNLEVARSKERENFEGWQRERADFSNYKRRIERDQVLLSQSVTGSIVKKYLVVQDDLQRALKARPSEGEGAVWSEGIALIYRKLQNILDGEGIVSIAQDGDMFDPTIHEAITHESSPTHQSGQIIEVLQHGYKIGDRVIRPALVRVAQ
jgi:molecular chaperone GrpE